MHRVVEQQLGRVGRGAVDAVYRVFDAAVAAVAGADQVLAAGQAELTGAGQGLTQQNGDVQWDDFGVDLPELIEQRLVEHAGELRQRVLLWGAAEVWRLAQVG
ncbi:hypothetical protein D3C81_1768210 [compost metagenome]